MIYKTKVLMHKNHKNAGMNRWNHKPFTVETCLSPTKLIFCLMKDMTGLRKIIKCKNHKNTGLTSCKCKSSSQTKGSVMWKSFPAKIFLSRNLSKVLLKDFTNFYSLKTSTKLVKMEKSKEKIRYSYKIVIKNYSRDNII